MKHGMIKLYENRLLFACEESNEFRILKQRKRLPAKATTLAREIQWLDWESGGAAVRHIREKFPSWSFQKAYRLLAYARDPRTEFVQEHVEEFKELLGI